MGLGPFQDQKDISGELHWSIAPRKPGNTLNFVSKEDSGVAKEEPKSWSLFEVMKIPHKGEVVHSNPWLSNPVPEAVASYTFQLQDPSISINPGTSAIYAVVRKLGRKVNFDLGEGLPQLGCGEDGDNEIERPPMFWPFTQAFNSPGDFPKGVVQEVSCGFEAFVRA